MIIYRDHSGSLSDSLKTRIEFDTTEQMKAYLVEKYTSLHFGISPFSIDDIVIGSDVFSDHRIGWNDVRHVCVNRFGDSDYISMYGAPQFIGWCATDYIK